MTTECPIAYFVLMTQCIIGVFVQTMLGGVIIAKVLRPKKRKQVGYRSTRALAIEESISSFHLVSRKSDKGVRGTQRRYYSFYSQTIDQFVSLKMLIQNVLSTLSHTMAIVHHVILRVEESEKMPNKISPTAGNALL